MSHSKSLCVLVLGDVGRSPRMQYHAYSLAEQFPQYRVQLVGHGGTPCFPVVQDHNRIDQLLFTPFTQQLNQKQSKLQLYVNAAYKFILQLVQLMYILLVKMRRPELILLQTPPAIPTLLAVYIVSIILNCTVIVDWHNLAYTLLQNKLTSHNNSQQPKSILIRISELYERCIGYLLCSNNESLCVTNAMRLYLKRWAGIHAVTLYDSPPDHFHSLNVEQQHALWLRLQSDYAIMPTDELFNWAQLHRTNNNTLFTEVDINGNIIKRSNRVASIISSTSWTADEDFTVLSAALMEYDAASQQPNNQLPKLLCIITGKGPLKNAFVQSIKSMNLVNVRIITMFVSSSDYPLILASVDIGISLHQSSSGLDLPMKVVDMYGSGLPVCAVKFDCIAELIDDGETGLLFNDSNQLSQQLQSLLYQYPTNTQQIDQFRDNVQHKHGQGKRWQYNWSTVALPLVNEALQRNQINQTCRLQQIIALLSLLAVCIAVLVFS